MDEMTRTVVVSDPEGEGDAVVVLEVPPEVADEDVERIVGGLGFLDALPAGRGRFDDLMKYVWAALDLFYQQRMDEAKQRIENFSARVWPGGKVPSFLERRLDNVGLAACVAYVGLYEHLLNCGYVRRAPDGELLAAGPVGGFWSLKEEVGFAKALVRSLVVVESVSASERWYEAEKGCVEKGIPGNADGAL